MRPGVWWLFLGTLAGRVLVASGGASAGHLSTEGRIQAAEVEPLPDDPAFDRDPRASEGSGGAKTATRPGRETVADRVEEEFGQVTHELDDLALTTLGRAERLASHLLRGTRTGATEVHDAYLAVTTTLTSLGRCFEEGVASRHSGRPALGRLILRLDPRAIRVIPRVKRMPGRRRLDTQRRRRNRTPTAAATAPTSTP